MSDNVKITGIIAIIFMFFVYCIAKVEMEKNRLKIQSQSTIEEIKK